MECCRLLVMGLLIRHMRNLSCSGELSAGCFLWDPEGKKIIFPRRSWTIVSDVKRNQRKTRSTIKTWHAWFAGASAIIPFITAASACGSSNPIVARFANKSGPFRDFPARLILLLFILFFGESQCMKNKFSFLFKFHSNSYKTFQYFPENLRSCSLNCHWISFYRHYCRLRVIDCLNLHKKDSSSL